ncbi:MAG: ABC transporter permease [Deltaproteobacteria bacterium]|nr:ABC transporter permease [Deltaproteobacteria bacterium]
MISRSTLNDRTKWSIENLSERNRFIVLKSLGVATLLVLWWIGSLFLPADVLPGPVAVAEAFADNVRSGVLLVHFRDTMQRIVLGFLLALSGGILVGTAMGLSKKIEDFIDTWVMVALTIPSLCFLIVIYILMGLNEFSTVLAIAISGFSSITINVWQGVKNVDNKLLAMARVFNVDRPTRFRRVVIPQIMPYILAASRYGLGIVWKITVVAELLGRNSGIGFQLHYWFQLFNMPQVFAWTLFFTFVMLFVELAIFKQIERHVFHWRPATKF